MKCFIRDFFFPLIILFPLILFGKDIPNPGFENWTDVVPDGWVTNNIPQGEQPIQLSSTSHNGSSSVKAEIVKIPPSSNPARLWSSFPVSQRHATLTGYYQLHQMASCICLHIDMQYNGEWIGFGYFWTGVQTSSWTPFNIPIIYFNPGQIPDTAFISISVMVTSANSPTTGTYALIDDLAFTDISDFRKEENANLMQKFQLTQNYPNPFNPTTAISFQLPELQHVRLDVLDILGRKVKTLIDGTKEIGTHEVQWDGTDEEVRPVTSGIYIYKLTAGSFEQSRKMVLLR